MSKGKKVVSLTGPIRVSIPINSSGGDSAAMQKREAARRLSRFLRELVAKKGIDVHVTLGKPLAKAVLEPSYVKPGVEVKEEPGNERPR